MEQYTQTGVTMRARSNLIRSIVSREKNKSPLEITSAINKLLSKIDFNPDLRKKLNREDGQIDPKKVNLYLINELGFENRSRKGKLAMIVSQTYMSKKELMKVIYFHYKPKIKSSKSRSPHYKESKISLENDLQRELHYFGINGSFE